MATDLIMPVLPGNQQFSSHFLPERPVHHHRRSQSYQIPPGPQISPLSTSDISNHNASTPGSPKAHHARHVRPLYMPAVLRPNSEFTPVKVVRSQTGSDTEPNSGLSSRRSSNSFITIPGLTGIGQRLTRRSTGDSGKSFDGEWDLDLFPEVTSVPTRKHWKPDTESSLCDDPTCKRNFNYFTRRHHCRRCGNIFCDSHSNVVVPLDQDANFNPRAPPSRSCNHCFEQFKVWHFQNASRTASNASDESQTAPATPIAAGHPDINAHGLPRSSDIAASVPRDWNWSTF
ncbi:FYVE-type zinc finger-containing protein [Paramyrothecium foliicola]|nr:FYVE-type zinc finger-containing protein [Paramyrothecium foliicola]